MEHLFSGEGFKGGRVRLCLGRLQHPHTAPAVCTVFSVATQVAKGEKPKPCLLKPLFIMPAASFKT